MKVKFILYIPERTVEIYIADYDSTEVLFLHGITIKKLHAAIEGLYYDYSSWEICQHVAENYTIELQNEEHLDADSARLINEIHERIIKLQKRGISLRTIRESLRSMQVVSRVVVTSDYRIILVDYDNMEVVMKPLSKALYLLYLHHPEGIAFKSLSNYSEELYKIYVQLLPNANPTRLRRHIENICDPLSNSINEKVSQIAHDFSILLDESLLPHYLILGKAGAPKCIKASCDCLFC